MSACEWFVGLGEEAQIKSGAETQEEEKKIMGVCQSASLCHMIPHGFGGD